MKKTNTKLQLKANTIRMLQTADLEPVNGGRQTATCTAAATGCSHPPQHPPGSGNNGNNGHH